MEFVSDRYPSLGAEMVEKKVGPCEARLRAVSRSLNFGVACPGSADSGSVVLDERVTRAARPPRCVCRGWHSEHRQ